MTLELLGKLLNPGFTFLKQDVKAAREALGWSLDEMAEKLSVPLEFAEGFETGTHYMLSYSRMTLAYHLWKQYNDSL